MGARYLAEHATKDIAHFADGCVRLDRANHARHHVLSLRGGLLDFLERGGVLGRRPRLPDALGALDLALDQTRIEDEWVERQGRFRLGVDVHSHDVLAPGLHALLVGRRGIGDLALDEAVLDRPHHAAAIEHLADQALRLFLQPRRQVLDVVRPAQRIDHVGHPVLQRQDLLGAHRDLDGALGGNLEGFVLGVGVQRLGSAEDGGEGLDGRARDVVVGLLRGQAHARGLASGPASSRSAGPSCRPSRASCGPTGAGPRGACRSPRRNRWRCSRRTRPAAPRSPHSVPARPPR